jgi:ABC-type polysaccharide/polyol phosphate export permease
VYSAAPEAVPPAPCREYCFPPYDGFFSFAIARQMYESIGIFYSIENKLDGILGELLIKCNPIALIICDLRRVLIYNQDPHWVALLAWFVVGIVISVIGIRTIYKHENSYVKVI